jgi:pimeloyl-ACP methyl ester carboxylesterase
VHLVGHSFGGWLAANYAVRDPERLASLSLLEPVFLRTSPLNDSQKVASSRGS